MNDEATNGDELSIPPGNVPCRLFPVFHSGAIPVVNLDVWTLSIFGEVQHALDVSLDELLALPRDVRRIDLHCVAGWSVMGSQWEGVPLTDVLARATIRELAHYIMLHCDGGYTTGLPLTAAADVLLAFRRNGADLTPEHGFPLRAVVSERYAWKSAKWLRGIELMPTERFGYREWYGYDNAADPWQDPRVE